MLSAEDFAAIRLAIELCANSELKKEILCAPGSDFERYKSQNKYDHQEQWHEMVENKATEVVEKLCLIKQLKKKVADIVILIGMRMLRWATYHERILRLSREFSFKFLNSSLFTSQGIVDNKKAAEELMKEKSLSIKQKYRIACIYCFKEQIPDLYGQMSQDDKYECCDNYYDEVDLKLIIKQHEMVKFWSRYFTVERDQVIRYHPLYYNMDEVMLISAVESGSKATVEYWLEKTDGKRNEFAVIDAALKIVRKASTESGTDFAFLYDVYSDFWIPSEYLADILCFLMSKMREDQLIEFLKRYFQLNVVSRVPHYLLFWPHQNYFMKTTKLMWEFIPEKTYAGLLLEICDKIDPSVGELNYAEERIYDYRKLLREFWCQSPDRYKRFVINDKKEFFMGVYESSLEEGTYITCLLYNLMMLRNFTDEDRKNIELILNSATDEEKESIILSAQGEDICIDLMINERWEILDEFMSNCLPSKEKASEFKRSFSITEGARYAGIHFMRDQRWDAAEFFMKWCSLAEEEIQLLKREMIYSIHGEYTCWELFEDEGVEITNKFCEWFLSSEEEIGEFKKKLIFTLGLVDYADLIRKEKLDVVDEFIKWSLLSQEEIGEFKERLFNEKGIYICKYLISECEWKPTFGPTFSTDNPEYKGGKWEEVEKYLTWCSLSQEEISDFKKRLLEESGKEIHYKLIKYNQWEEAERFFAWLELSPEEVKRLKKKTLWNYEEVVKMFDNLVYSPENDKRYSDDESRQVAVELYLRWFLTDEETVLEFRDHFEQRYKGKELTQGYLDFDSAIQRRLSDLEEEQSKENLN